MLGYRTLFTVPNQSDDVCVVALSQLNAWLREKDLDSDALRYGHRVALAPHADGALQELTTGDGSQLVRARIWERGRGLWTSTLTIQSPADPRRDPWVWLDVEGPGRSGLPRLARRLLDVFEARDGIARLSSRPEVLTPDDVHEIADVIRDPDRRRLVFVAGSDDQMPMARWVDLLARLLRDTVGLASAYVLDGPATDQLAVLLGPTHAVAPGTIRTFADRVAEDDPADSLRHRVLTTQRILRGDAHAVARTLGNRARAVSTEQPLPRAAVRADRLLERQMDELLLTTPSVEPGSTVAEPPGAGPIATSTPATSPSSAFEPAVEDHAAPATSPQDVAAGAELYLALGIVARSILGVEEPAVVDVMRLGALASEAVAAEARQLQLSQRLSELQARVETAEDALRDVRRRLEDEQLEHAVTLGDSVKSGELVRHLRRLVVRSGEGAAAWSEPDPDPLDQRPESFDDLLSRTIGLSGVAVELKDPDTARSLDEHESLGVWAAKTWEVLLALHDYVAAKHAGAWDRDVDGYLRHTPDGYRSYLANRHARDESEDVKANGGYRKARFFPVPETIAESGSIFMGAHFKIANSGLISPRLHYHDATAVDGKVYVGYIGPHLPTQQSN